MPRENFVSSDLMEWGHDYTKRHQSFRDCGILRMRCDDYYIQEAKEYVPLDDPFAEAERLFRIKEAANYHGVKRVKDVPMPRIAKVDGMKGPIVPFKEWYIRGKLEHLGLVAEDYRDYQEEMIENIAERDRLRFILGTLDPGSKKDMKKAVKINSELRNLECELIFLKDITGIEMDTIEKGSKLGIFYGHAARFFKRVKKSIKKFFKKHEDMISGIASVVVPTILGGVARKIFKRNNTIETPA